jgi:hypothetical protein
MDSSPSSSPSPSSVLNQWIQETAETAGNYTALGDQLITALLSKRKEAHEQGLGRGEGDEEDGSELISKTVGDLLSRVYLSDLSSSTSGGEGWSGDRRTTETDLSEHYQR